MFSPKTVNSIGIECSIVTDNWYVLGLCLCDQHSIKWIFVGTGKQSCSHCMVDAYRQRFELLSRQMTGEVLCQLNRIIKLSQIYFNGDLPS